VNGWTAFFLGVIAVATLAMAIIQIGVIVAAGRLARRVDRLADAIEQEIKPLAGHLNTIGREASRAMTLAAAQVERADQLFGDFAGRVDQTLNALQASIVAPAREGRALLRALQAMVGAIREKAPSRSGRGDDEDALFI
jgi:hypothetical protein